MPLPYFYQTDIEWNQERIGQLRSPGLTNIQIAAPPEFKGHENMWTPEHLFTSAVSSCFMTTFLAIAEMSKLEFVSFSADAVGKLEKLEGQGFVMTEILLRPRLKISRSQDADRATRILEKAEKNCLISNSIKTAVRVEPVVESALENEVLEELFV